jgi:hypothetical protein
MEEAMIVLKSKHDRELKLAHDASKAACISRDLWRTAAKGFEARAIAAEAELAKRKAHAISNLRQYKAKPVFDIL